MQKYKYVIGIVAIVLLGVAAVVFMNNRDGISAEKNHAGEVGSRIPKLAEGVNVHELENEIFAVLGPESVAVTTNRSSGSGILWGYDGKKIIVITTKHLMQEFESGELELWTGEKVTFSKENMYASKELDLSAIILSCKEKLKLDEVKVANHLVEKVPEIGATLWVIDSVYGAASGIGTCSVASSELFLEDYGAEMLLLYGEGKNGMSGSPMYDEYGKLVAMMSGMSEDGTTMAAVSVGKIMKFLETLEE